MALFGGKAKKEGEELPTFEDQGKDAQQVSKEIELVATIKDEFSITVNGILRQSPKKLKETNEQLGKIEGKLHNIKIYQQNLKSMAEDLEAKLLHMRGGSSESLAEDLSEEEQRIITYFRGIVGHLTSIIQEMRELRKLLSKVSIVPTGPETPPLEAGKEFGSRVVEIVHKVEGEVGELHDNLGRVYDLDKEVHGVAKEHGVDFAAVTGATPAQGQDGAQQPPPQG